MAQWRVSVSALKGRSLCLSGQQQPTTRAAKIKALTDTIAQLQIVGTEREKQSKRKAGPRAPPIAISPRPIVHLPPDTSPHLPTPAPTHTPTGTCTPPHQRHIPILVHHRADIVNPTRADSTLCYLPSFISLPTPADHAAIHTCIATHNRLPTGSNRRSLTANIPKSPTHDATLPTLRPMATASNLDGGVVLTIINAQFARPSKPPYTRCATVFTFAMLTAAVTSKTPTATYASNLSAIPRRASFWPPPQRTIASPYCSAPRTSPPTMTLSFTVNAQCTPPDFLPP